MKKLPIACGFGNLHDELVHDQIVMYAKNKGIEQRLWAERVSSLKDIMAVLKKAELPERCAMATLSQEKKESGES